MLSLEIIIVAMFIYFRGSGEKSYILIFLPLSCIIQEVYYLCKRVVHFQRPKEWKNQTAMTFKPQSAQ